MSAPPIMRVLYNGACPICRFEIEHWKKVTARRDLPIVFDDLNGPARADWNMDADEAAQRLHVRWKGRRLSGFPAFLALWSQMPGMRWLAWSLGLPGLRQVVGAAYDRVAAPMLYRAHLRRQARRDG